MLSIHTLDKFFERKYYLRQLSKRCVNLIYDGTHMSNEKCEPIRASKRKGSPGWEAVLGNGGVENSQPLGVLRVKQHTLDDGTHDFVTKPCNNLVQ